MRYVFRFWFALTLSLALMAGCSDENGEGGTAGTGGMAGTGGEGGAGGSAGTGGMAGTGGEGGAGGSNSEVFPCTEQGILDAIALGGGPHTFACDGPTTVVTNATIDISSDVILDGEGNLTADGNDDHTVFSVWTPVAVELRGFTVTNGSGEFAGGILSVQATLSLVDSIVAGNRAIGPTGGYCGSCNSGGGVQNLFGTLSIINSTVSGNAASVGGGIYSVGSLTVMNSTVSGNSSGNDGGGIYHEAGNLTVINSTVSGNSSGEAGGGIYADGYRFGLLAVINSTVSGNAAGTRGGGIAIVDGTTKRLSYNTISGNSANQGAAIATSLPMHVKVAANVIDGDCDPALLTLAPGGTSTSRYNIESPGDTCGLEHETDQVNVIAEQLNLGPLQDNGGPTMTHALGVGSVAIDVIPEADCVDGDGEPLTTDQRGQPRPETGGSLCDVGAFELQP